MNCTIFSLNETLQTCLLNMCSKKKVDSESDSILLILFILFILLIYAIILYSFKKKYCNILINGLPHQKKATNDLMFEIDFLSLLLASLFLPFILKTFTAAAFLTAFCKIDFDFQKAILKMHRNMVFDGLIPNPRTYKNKNQNPDEEKLIDSRDS